MNIFMMRKHTLYYHHTTHTKANTTLCSHACQRPPALNLRARKRVITSARARVQNNLLPTQEGDGMLMVLILNKKATFRLSLAK